MLKILKPVKDTSKLRHVKSDVILNNSKLVCEEFRKVFDPDLLEVQEIMWALYLNRTNKIIGAHLVAMGGISMVSIDPRLVLNVALRCLAAGVVLAHNHPSGSLEVSISDKEMTEELKQALRLMNIKLLDHLIITETAYRSLADEGYL